MEAEKRKAQILQVLARTVRKILEEEKMEFTYLQEIRLRIGQPLRVIYDNEEKTLPIREKQKYIDTSYRFLSLIHGLFLILYLFHGISYYLSIVNPPTFSLRFVFRLS